MAISSDIWWVWLVAGLILFVAGFLAGRRLHVGRNCKPPIQSGSCPSRHELKHEPVSFDVADDQSVQAFLDRLPVNENTVPTFLHLSRLLRQKGQFDQSLTIHQYLFGRPNLPKAMSQEIQLNLARDYFDLGLDGRAENLLESLADERGEFQLRAVSELVKLCEERRDWVACISWSRRLGKKASDYQKKALSHYYCELAELKIRQNIPGRAMEYLGLAEKVDQSNPRVFLLRYRIAMDSGADVAALVGLLSAAVQAQPLFSGVVLDVAKNGSPDVQEGLRGILCNRGSATMLPSVIADLFCHGGESFDPETAHTANPRVVSEILKTMPADDVSVELRPVVDWARKAVHSDSLYQCQKCGFELSSHEWQCPGCKTWEGVIDKSDWLVWRETNHRKLF